MLGWLKERFEVAKLTRERADRLADENKMLRNLAHAKQQEIDRLNKVIDEVTNVVHSWKR